MTPASRLPLYLIISALTGLGGVSGARADEAAVARLRARVAASPDDHSLRCQLSFALVGVESFAEAHALAGQSVAGIAWPLTARTRRTYAACLYNRGRAAEGLGRLEEAARDYVRSNEARPSDAVVARLTAIVPETPASFPAAALLTFTAQGGETGVWPMPEQRVASTTTSAGVRWDFVTALVSEPRGFSSLATYALAWREGDVIVARVDSWTQEDQDGSVVADGARVFARSTPSEGVAVDVTATGGGACGEMDGFMDFEHRATVLVALAGDTIRSRALVTRERDCEGRASMRVELRGEELVVSRSRRGTLSDGTYQVSAVLR